MMGVKSSFALSGQLHFHSLSTASPLQWIPRASNAIATLFTPPCSCHTQSGHAHSAKREAMPAKVVLWSAWQGVRPLTPHPPTTSSPPLAPLEVPRRPQYATVLEPSFRSLSCPCHACTEPPEPANARASSWLHPELAPPPLSILGALLQPHEHCRQPLALSLGRRAIATPTRAPLPR